MCGGARSKTERRPETAYFHRQTFPLKIRLCLFSTRRPSALDNESERLVQQSLDELSKNRTTITIAHRLTTIRKADRILVLTEDGIVEEGKLADLIEKKGIYATLYSLYGGEVNEK